MSKPISAMIVVAVVNSTPGTGAQSTDQFDMRLQAIAGTLVHLHQLAVQMTEFVERFFQQPAEMLGIKTVQRNGELRPLFLKRALRQLLEVFGIRATA